VDDQFRVSDADRDRCAALLRGHFAAGLLSAGELDERLTAALRATILGDLRRVLTGLPGAGDGLQQAGFRSPETGPLARSYRRLLACYPAWYRRVYADEMLAVLMAGAPQDKQRATIAEAADLLLGALRIRCQPARTGEGGPIWRDALAVLSVIVPLLILLTSAAQMIQEGPPLWGPRDLALPSFGLAALVPLGLRMRRLAALTAAAVLIWLLSGLPSRGVELAVGNAYLFLAAGVELLALTASPGPRRGLQILTWKHGAFTVIATLLAGTDVISVTQPVRLVVIAVICAGMVLASSLGRWLLLLLAIPAYPYFAGPSFFDPLSAPGAGIARAVLPFSPAMLAPYYLPSLALVIVAIAAVRRASFRSSCPPSSTA
jgi:hypothetical protein